MTARAEQHAATSPPAGERSVAIVKLAREFDWWAWLCAEHLAEWQARGWQLRERKRPKYPLTCSDCTEGDNAAAVASAGGRSA